MKCFSSSDWTDWCKIVTTFKDRFNQRTTNDCSGKYRVLKLSNTLKKYENLVEKHGQLIREFSKNKVHFGTVYKTVKAASSISGVYDETHCAHPSNDYSQQSPTFSQF